LVVEQSRADRRATVAIGVALIALGVVFLVGRQVDVAWAAAGWPLIVIAAGLVLFVVAVAVGGSGGAGFAVPAGIVTMTGFVLAVQQATGLWETWAYAWALVAPGGVGAGLLVYGLVSRQTDIARGGGMALLVGVGLFFGFGLFFEGVIGLSGVRLPGIDLILSAGLVALGVVIVGLSVVGRSRGSSGID
jgi:hypothetical protein